MAVHIEVKQEGDDEPSVTIHADDGSSVRGVTVGDRVIIDRTGTILPPKPPPTFWDKPGGRMLVYGLLLGFCVFVWSCIFAACARVAHCDDCSAIRDPDERHMCMALTHRLKSECEFIKRPDLRQQCRIKLEKDK